MPEAGQITPAGLQAIQRAKADGFWTVYDEIEDRVIPPDLARSLADNPEAAHHFTAFGDSSKKGILWWIKSAKQPATRQKRIAETVALAQHNVRADFPEAREFKRRHGGPG